MDIGLPELIIILVILLLLFGSKKLPEMARSIGQSGKEIKDAFDTTNSTVAKTKSEINKTLSGVNGKLADADKEVRAKSSSYGKTTYGSKAEKTDT